MADVYSDPSKAIAVWVEQGSSENSEVTKIREKRRLNNEKSIKLVPLWAYVKGGDDLLKNTLALPVSPSEIMFNNDSEASTLKLMNYGELPVYMNRKLATWTVTSLFPKKRDTVYEYDALKNGIFPKLGRYWFDMSGQNGQESYEAYGDYCSILYDWKMNQTPLVFMYKTWGEYYYCQIKSFKHGNQDATGNVYYELQIQEYKKYDRIDISYETTNFNSATYTVQEGETLLTISKRLYGNTRDFIKLMDLNNLNTTEIKVGQVLKIK